MAAHFATISHGKVVLHFVNSFSSKHFFCLSELTSTRLLMVLELADVDLKSHLKLRRENGTLSDHVITFYWTEMLACVKVIHDRSEFCL